LYLLIILQYFTLIIQSHIQKGNSDKLLEFLVSQFPKICTVLLVRLAGRLLLGCLVPQLPLGPVLLPEVESVGGNGAADGTDEQGEADDGASGIKKEGRRNYNWSAWGAGGELTSEQPILVVEVLNITEGMESDCRTHVNHTKSPGSRVLADLLFIAELWAGSDGGKCVESAARLHNGHSHNVGADIGDVLANLEFLKLLEAIPCLFPFSHMASAPGDDLRLFVAIKVQSDVAEVYANLGQLLVQFLQKSTSIFVFRR
jgi:hypothetical protein